MTHPLSKIIERYMRGEITDADVKQQIEKYKKVMEMMRKHKVEW